MPTQKACQNGDVDSELGVETSSVYSNPLQPALSVMLALAVYHFSYPPSDVPTDSIWGFSAPEDVFGNKLKALLAVLETRADFLRHIGATSVDQIASHSLRKGQLLPSTLWGRSGHCGGRPADLSLSFTNVPAVVLADAAAVTSVRLRSCRCHCRHADAIAVVPTRLRPR